MKLNKILSAAMSGVMAAAVCAQTPPGNTQSPKAAQTPSLPAGHPDIGSAPGKVGPSLPAGHPTIPSGPAAGSGQLPSGHPDISGAAPANRPAATHGALFIRAYQATKDGPAIGEEVVAVELYHRGKIIQKLDAKLDKTGATVLEKIPLLIPFQPVVKVTHAGVEYQALGEIMDGQHAGQQIEMALYEATDQVPDWSVHMRHVMVEPASDGVKVTEMIAIENPADRSWLGTTAPDGKRATTVIPLPAGADRFQITGGAREGTVKSVDGKLVNSMPLIPGFTQLQFTYFVPVQSGQARVNIIAPSAVKHMMLFVVDNGATIKAEGLEASGSHEMGRNKALIFGANDLKSGHETVVTITIPPQKSASASPPGTVSYDAARIIAGVGGGVALAVGTGYVLLKAPKAAKAL